MQEKEKSFETVADAIINYYPVLMINTNIKEVNTIAHLLTYMNLKLNRLIEVSIKNNSQIADALITTYLKETGTVLSNYFVNHSEKSITKDSLKDMLIEGGKFFIVENKVSIDIYQLIMLLKYGIDNINKGIISGKFRGEKNDKLIEELEHILISIYVHLLENYKYL